MLPGVTAPRLVGVVLALTLGGVVVGRSPVGPFALDRGDVLYGHGDAQAALRHWGRVGRWHPVGSVRIAADLRAAEVAETALGDGEAARRLLRRVVEHERPDPAVLAQAWARLAALMAADGGRVQDAVDAWRTALRVDPEAAQVGAWRRAVATTLSEAGHLQEALLAWDAVLDAEPAEASHVYLAQGALLLAADDVVGALEAYESAEAAREPAVRQAAALGSASAHARLGELDLALEALERAGLPEPVAASRAQALRARMQEQDAP